MGFSQEEVFKILEYKFDNSLIDKIRPNHYIKNLWPIIYIISDSKLKKAYVGETTDGISRMSTHLKNSDKNVFSNIQLILSDKFNKSAALDIESKLISYITADKNYSLINGNLGIANHNYFQKHDFYNKIFKNIWDKLRSMGFATHSIESIDNSDLFKYSPYKSLDVGQINAIVNILDNILDSNNKTTIINGGAGTGKSIIAIFLFKLLHTDLNEFRFSEFDNQEQKEIIVKIQKIKNQFKSLKIGLVIPMASFRKTLKNVFSQVNGLKSDMVIGPSDVIKDDYDILLVDESHRLRKRVNLTNYASFDNVSKKLNLDPSKTNELEWVQKRSKKLILFYDKAQSIKPSDVDKKHFDELILRDNSKIYQIYSQFRVRGGNGYSLFISKLLNLKLNDCEVYSNSDYELLLFNSFDDMKREINLRNSEYGLSRLISGYSWKWISGKDSSLYDIEIEKSKLKWNTISIDWINSKNSVDEVGCIHTTQGYDLNYAGIIFGKEIRYDVIKKEIIIDKDNYHDKNGKNSIKNLDELKEYILNIYQTLMLRGIRGTYIYVCDSNLREYFSKHIKVYGTIKQKIDFIKNSNEKNIIPFYIDLNFEKPDAHIKYLKKEVKDSYFAIAINNHNYAIKIVPNNTICLFEKIEKFENLDGMIILVQDIINQDLHLYEFKKNKNKILLQDHINSKSIEFDKNKFKIVAKFKEVLGFEKDNSNINNF